MSDGLERAVHRAYQFTALIFAPIMLWVGMVLIRLLHDVAVDLYVGTSGGGTSTTDQIIIFFIHLAALGAFVALVWFLYNFVRNAGWGLFD